MSKVFSAHRKHATSLMIIAIGSPHQCSRGLVTKANTTQGIRKICVAMIPNSMTSNILHGMLATFHM